MLWNVPPWPHGWVPLHATPCMAMCLKSSAMHCHAPGMVPCNMVVATWVQLLARFSMLSGVLECMVGCMLKCMVGCMVVAA